MPESFAIADFNSRPSDYDKTSDATLHRERMRPKALVHPGWAGQNLTLAPLTFDPSERRQEWDSIPGIAHLPPRGASVVKGREALSESELALDDACESDVMQAR